MDYIREKVSQTKVRFMQDGFNLDLSYITPRIIAMAFPADGLESVYRNPIDEVSRFMNEKHKDHYMIFNASNRGYNYEKFNQNVYVIEWPNHYPCPFISFTETILTSTSFLLQNPENVIAVHCLAGKGRTGSLICGILYCSFRFKTILEANQFYLQQRGVNVTYPSQLRYLLYFSQFFNQGAAKLNFDAGSASQVIIQVKDKNFFMGKEFLIEFEDFSISESLFELTFDGNQCRKSPKDEGYVYIIDIPKWENPECKDILLTLKTKGMMYNNLLFRVNFCMFFVDDTLNLYNTDLDEAKDLPDDFKILVKFKRTKSDQSSKFENTFKIFRQRVDIIRTRYEKEPDYIQTFFGDKLTE